MQKVVQISTRYFDNQHLTLDMLQKNREKMQEIINNWKQSKNYKYVKEFIDICDVQTYFGTDK